jgi:hypothetical protein
MIVSNTRKQKTKILDARCLMLDIRYLLLDSLDSISTVQLLSLLFRLLTSIFALPSLLFRLRTSDFQLRTSVFQLPQVRWIFTLGNKLINAFFYNWFIFLISNTKP